MSEIDELVVVVPANDEEALIARCLDALDASIARYRELAGDTVTRIRVIVVLDACVDRTAEIVRRYPGVQAIEVGFRNVGAARGSGVDAAIAGARHPLERVWIANTDADSAVPEHWVVRQLALARAGSAVVVGTIRPDRRDLTTEQYRAWQLRAEAEHASGESGERIHGANLGIRADTYLAIGGFHPLLVGEDVDLVGRARDALVKVVVSDVCWVETSARTVGRAPGGYAEYVRAHY